MRVHYFGNSCVLLDFWVSSLELQVFQFAVSVSCEHLGNKMRYSIYKTLSYNIHLWICFFIHGKFPTPLNVEVVPWNALSLECTIKPCPNLRKDAAAIAFVKKQNPGTNLILMLRLCLVFKISLSVTKKHFEENKQLMFENKRFVKNLMFCETLCDTLDYICAYLKSQKFLQGPNRQFQNILNNSFST